MVAPRRRTFPGLERQLSRSPATPRWRAPRFTAQAKFNPATLHQRLCQHPEYRRRFADLVQKHLYGDGALTPTNAQQRFRSRMNEIDLAIIGESARWGRGKTRDATWLPACNSVLNTYLSQRRDIIVGHFRNRGWFPSLDAPGYSVMNTVVASGHILRVYGTSTFYYTTDGIRPAPARRRHQPVCHRGDVQQPAHRTAHAHQAGRRLALFRRRQPNRPPAANSPGATRGFPDASLAARAGHPRFPRQRNRQSRCRPSRAVT